MRITCDSHESVQKDAMDAGRYPSGRDSPGKSILPRLLKSVQARLQIFRLSGEVFSLSQTFATRTQCAIMRRADDAFRIVYKIAHNWANSNGDGIKRG